MDGLAHQLCAYAFKTPDEALATRHTACVGSGGMRRFYLTGKGRADERHYQPVWKFLIPPERDVSPLRKDLRIFWHQSIDRRRDD